jgi:hypothetical protein
MPKPLTVEVFLGALAFATAGAACTKSAPEVQPSVVDAGVELAAPPSRKAPAASCGATGCSPDMKKNK